MALMMMRSGLILSLLLLACTSEDAGDGDTAVDGSATMMMVGDDTSASADETVSAGAETPLPGDDTHGVVKLELTRADNEAASPFLGTASVVVTLDYLECLISFYDTEVEWRMEGPMGAPVFDEWRDELCAFTGPADATCSVSAITQELDVSKHLSVMYDVTMEPDLENLTLYFGPLPTAELAMCEGGTNPIVRVGSNGAVRGLAANGDVVWEMKSFDPDKVATNQGQAIRVRAGLP